MLQVQTAGDAAQEKIALSLANDTEVWPQADQWRIAAQHVAAECVNSTDGGAGQLRQWAVLVRSAVIGSSRVMEQHTEPVGHFAGGLAREGERQHALGGKAAFTHQ